ncbi:methyltransferase domain-containing protein [Thermodesulfobacteriota bacterium]
MDRIAHLPRNSRVLEIGAAPFGLTFLLRHFVFKDVRATQLTNSSVGSKNLNQTIWADLVSTEGRRIDNFEVRQFNLEKDPWPYENESFDLIVACEVFEHLATDPMHVVCEAGRVLREGGRMFISTPNVMSLWKIDRLFEGLQPNVDPFYRKSVYNRHNRELTPHEIKILLKSGGFSVEFIETVNVKRMVIAKPFRFFLIRLLAGSIQDRRDIIFAMGRKTAPVCNRYPEEYQLYRSKK